MSYFPVQTISTYSLLQSTTTPKKLVAAAKTHGYSAVALTDYDVLYGVVDFYQAAKAADIKPLLGVTLRVQGLINQGTEEPLVFIAKNQQGYQNLLKLSSYKMTLGNQATAKLADVWDYLHDLFVITPMNGEVVQLLQQGEFSQAKAYLEKLQPAVDPASLMIGVSLEHSHNLQQTIVQLAAETHTQAIPNDLVEYLTPQEYFPTRVLRAVDAGITLSNIGEARNELGNHFMRPAAEMEGNYQRAGLADALHNLEQMLHVIDVDLQFQEPQLPKFPVPTDQSAVAYLATLAQKGLQTRGLADLPAYQARLQDELKVIDELGFNDYFLIVWDVLNWAHQQKIQTGPGRGSAAGSLVAYVLAITDVDPIEYDLLFERFLNPERAQMPDIDIDIPDTRREAVLEYVHQRYGHENVGQIITFGTLAAKQALRDTGRVFGYNPQQLSELSKTLPNALHFTIDEAWAESQAFRNLMIDLPNGELLVETAKMIEGLPRNYSTHAAGVVIAGRPLTDVVPVQAGPDGRLMTQLPKNPVEALGLLKMDFLGLRNLTLLADALANVQVMTGEPFDITTIDLNDQKTLELFQQARTNGVFQFESNGIKNVLRKLQPDSFEMIAAVNALFRPGPMENIDHFIARKHGQEAITYPDAVLEPILAPTFGIIVYQEQVMQVASVLAGFSFAEADLLRRAMSKKDANKLDSLRSQFIAGALKLGHSEAVAIQVYDYIEAFANYGFNRSHAVAYSKMAFQLAYLKAHYPAAFFAALMNSAIGNDVKTKTYIQEVKQQGVAVLSPDINRSYQNFTLFKGAIRFGLSSVKGLRSDFVRDLLTEREAKGPFADLADLISRLPDKWRKADLLNLLIYTGACDNFGYNRNELLQSLPGFIEAIGLSGDSLSLFETMAPKVKKLPDLALSEKLSKEAEYLGAYVSAHPVEQYRQQAIALNAVVISDLQVDQKVMLAVFVNHIRTIRTKKGEEMAFLTGNDATGEISITVFPRLYKQLKEQLTTQRVYFVAGKVESNRGLQVIADQIRLASSITVGKPSGSVREKSKEVATGQWYLRIQAAADNPTTQRELERILEHNHGANPVLLVYAADDRKILLKANLWLKKNNETLESLTSLLGRGNVVFKPNDV